MKFPYPSLFLAVLCVSIAATLSLTGCGGGANSTTPNPSTSPGSVVGTGRATLTILWTPRAEEASRLIPIATQSLHVFIRKNNGDIVADRIVLRPAGQNETTVTFEDLPVETLRVIATAHPQEDGSGTAQAQAEALVTVNLGENAPIRIRLQSTITRLEVIPDKLQAKVGESVNITVSARNEAGELIMITSDSQKWTVSEEVIRSGATQITGVLVGQARIEVRETESGTSGGAEILIGRSGEYFIREIAPPAGLDACKPTGLTNDGYIVGTCTPQTADSWKSFAWDEATKSTVLLPRPEGFTVFLASGVNESRQIVGTAATYNTTIGSGFLLENETKFTKLQQLVPQGDIVIGLNNRGDIFGTAGAIGSRTQIGLWKTNGTGKLLNTNYSFTHQPFAINEQGFIVGQANGAGLVWNTDGRTPIRLLPPHEGISYQMAFDVNENGLIAGYCPIQQTADSLARRIITWNSPNSVPKPYPTLLALEAPYVVNIPQMLRMNNRNEIIVLKVNEGSPALVLKNGVIADLTTLVPPDWKSLALMCINDRGQIAGTAEKNGKKTMFLLTPQGGSGNLKVGVQ